jgi:hypothetical protein
MLFPQLSRPSNQSLLTLFTCTRCPSASVWLYDRKEGSGGRSRLHRQLVLVKKATLGFTPHRAPAQSLEENRARRIRCATRLRVAVRHHSTAVRTSVVYLYDALRSTRDGAGAGVTQRTGMWRWLAGGGSGPVQLSQGGRHRVRAAHSRRTQLRRGGRSCGGGRGPSRAVKGTKRFKPHVCVGDVDRWYKEAWGGVRKRGRSCSWRQLAAM